MRITLSVSVCVVFINQNSASEKDDEPGTSLQTNTLRFFYSLFFLPADKRKNILGKSHPFYTRRFKNWTNFLCTPGYLLTCRHFLRDRLVFSFFREGTLRTSVLSRVLYLFFNAFLAITEFLCIEKNKKIKKFI